MKNLNVFVNQFNESEDHPQLKDVVGKDPKEIKSKGRWKGKWAVDEPTDDDVLDDAYEDATNKSENLMKLRRKFDSEDPFFVQGPAGWGKSSVIKNMAKRYKRHVITVYLDKAEASDLGGLPVATTNKEGDPEQRHLMPPWGHIIADNPDINFLLFLDEMNQADPAVINALMPIVNDNVICGLELDNYFVGSAGNLMEENEAGLTDLRDNQAFFSRVKPIIIWQKEWEPALDYIREKWTDKVGKELIDAVDEAHEAFVNPRELTKKCIQWAYKIKENGFGNAKRYSAENNAKYLFELCKPEGELTRDQHKQVLHLADAIHSYLSGEDTSASTGRSASKKKDAEMVDDNFKKEIRKAMKRGYFEDIQKDKNGKVISNDRYGCSRENIIYLFTQTYSPETIQRIVNKFEADGVKFKYEKNSEWKKAGYLDPEAD